MTVALTEEQEQVVGLRDGSYLVLAPPGTGKTEVIAQRIVRLLTSSRTESFRILALTFNKMAASTMRTRARTELRDDTWRATIETYHSFYLDILRHYGNLIGIPPEVTVYDTTDAKIHALVQGLIDEGHTGAAADLSRRDAEEILDDISRMKRALIVPAAAPPGKRYGSFTIRDAYIAYEGALKRNGAVDFDGMLTRTYDLLSEHPEVAEHYRRMYRYILVDEAQDTSTVQFEILRAICGDAHRNVFMVADPDQLINRWMGADRKNLDRFVSDFDATTFHLTANFRCADEIVVAANNLLAAGSGATQTTINPSGRAKGLVRAASFRDERSEALAVVDWIAEIRDRGLHDEWVAEGEPTQTPPETIAVLARSRLHLREVLAVLKERGEAYTFRAGDDGPFDSDTYRLILDAMRVLANPRDVAMKKTFLAALGGDVSEEPTSSSLIDADIDAFFAAAADSGDGFTGEIFRVLSRTTDVGTAMLSLTVAPADESADTEFGELLRADRQLLVDRWMHYKNATESSDWSWPAALMAIIDEPRRQVDGFRVSTVHAAKGLEFSAVAVVGLNDGSFPDFRNTELSEDLDGERRLMYVAATRASRALFLSRPRSRTTRYGSRGQEESRFLADMSLTTVTV